MGWLDADRWNHEVARSDVYFSPAYHALHEANGDGRAVCFATDGLLVPGMRIAINDTLADVQTCNGYGGPLAIGDGSLAQAWNDWRETARADGIVAGFFRLHPLLGNRALLPADAVVRRERQTVFVDVAAPPDARHRNMINKARRSEAHVQWTQNWDAFVALYRQSMERLGGSPSLNFSDAYFAGLRALPGAELAALVDEQGLVAAAVFLWGPQYAHYHLAARRPDAPNYAASFVLQAALERAAERNLVGMHLGGGTTAAPDDPLLRFKRSLGGQLLDFEVALVVADEPAFRELVVGRTQALGREPSWLLGYRQPG